MSERIEKAHELFKAVNSGRWAEIAGLFDEEGVLVFPGTSALSGSYEGRDMIGKYFRRMNIAVRNIAFDIKSVTEGGETVMIEWENRGTTRKGSDYHNEGVTVLHFRNGMILRLRDYLDTEKLH